MFALLQEQAAEKVEQAPILVRLVNHYFGEWAYNFEMKYTYPKWKWLLAKFGGTPEAAFGVYTPENAIPWYTVMFVLACILSIAVIWILKGKLSEDEPGHGQQTLELGVLAVRDMTKSNNAKVIFMPVETSSMLASVGAMTEMISETVGKHSSDDSQQPPPPPRQLR